MNSNQLKLINFGLSGHVQPGVMQDTYCGTAAYASLEILAGKKHEGPESDVWAMGIVLYGMLHAKFPFSSAKGIQVRVQINDASQFMSPILLSTPNPWRDM
jgi:serine/threonine protein kinase